MVINIDHAFHHTCMKANVQMNLDKSMYLGSGQLDHVFFFFLINLSLIDRLMVDQEFSLFGFYLSLTENLLCSF